VARSFDPQVRDSLDPAGPQTAGPAQVQSSRRRFRSAPAPAVWSTAPILLLVCLRAQEILATRGADRPVVGARVLPCRGRRSARPVRERARPRGDRCSASDAIGMWRVRAGLSVRAERRGLASFWVSKPSVARLRASIDGGRSRRPRRAAPGRHAPLRPRRCIGLKRLPRLPDGYR